jgi:uncharacterized membrane protein YccC
MYIGAWPDEFGVCTRTDRSCSGKRFAQGANWRDLYQTVYDARGWLLMKASVASAPSHDLLLKKPEWLDDETTAAVTFAAKTFVAGVLALYVAFWLGLDEPRWALLTVYVVSQPESGLVLAKSFYRTLGTAAGLLFSTFLVFMFAQYGDLFVPSVALWIGICNFAARAARNFMSYGFLLAGYTAAIVGVPAALDPSQAYTLIAARGTEIVIGLTFAALASRLLFPRELAQRLLALTRRIIIRAREFGSAANGPAADKTALAAQRFQLIQDLALIDSTRASANFESAEARRLNEPVREVAVAALDVCAIAEDIANRPDSALPSSTAGLWITARLLSNTNDSPTENFAVTSTLTSVSDQRDMADAQSKLIDAENRLEGRLRVIHPTVSLATWSDPTLAILTGVRTALAVVVVWAIWFVTAWPSGPVAIIVAANVCSIIAAMERPVRISLALAATILVATVPVFFTVFYLLPLASDFVGMALALAPLMLTCGFVMAQPKIGAMGQLTAVYFTVGSNIDNVMTYNTVQFFNTSLAILSGIGVALVLFAIIFPETPAQALRLLRRQLRRRLSRFSATGESPLSSFAYALCDQAAYTFVRVKDESFATRQCYAMTMTALATAYSIDRLKRTLNGTLPPRIKHEIVMLLGRVSETFAAPSRAGLVKQAWDARGLRIRILKEARAADKIREITSLGRALVGCERLRSSLLKSRVFLSEGHHAR